jgi:hypothetical protein
MKSIVSAALAYGYAQRQQVPDEWAVKLPGAGFQGMGRPTAGPLTRNRIVSVASPSTTAAAHGRFSRAAAWTAVKPTAAHADHLRLSRGPSPDPFPA